MVLSETCKCILEDEKRLLLDGLERGINFQKNIRWDVETTLGYSKEWKDAVLRTIDEQVETRQRLIVEINKVRTC